MARDSIRASRVSCMGVLLLMSRGVYLVVRSPLLVVRGSVLAGGHPRQSHEQRPTDNGQRLLRTTALTINGQRRQNHHRPAEGRVIVETLDKVEPPGEPLHRRPPPAPPGSVGNPDLPDPPLPPPRHA